MLHAIAATRRIDPVEALEQVWQVLGPDRRGGGC